MAEESPNSVVTLSPSQVLSFDLGSAGETRAVLTITNISGQKIAYKIKTSQPSWYLVRPNQNVIDVGKSDSVIIALTDSEKSKVLELSNEGSNTLNLDKHRFLLMSKVISSGEYASIMDLHSSQRAEEYARIWGSGKEEVANMKLKVNFTYPEPGSRRGSNHKNSPASSSNVTDNAEELKQRLAREDSTDTMNGSADAIMSELINLRKKYDAVVDYSAHLTTERDSIVAQFEDLQREYARECGGKKIDSKTGKVEKQVDKKPVQQGFSLVAMVIVVIVSILIGRYVPI